jgi:superfamily II RNA helicase
MENMRQIIENYKKEIEGNKNMLIEYLVKSGDFEDMEVEELTMFKSVLSLLDSAMKFTIAQAEAIDRIEKKLDSIKN